MKARRHTGTKARRERQGTKEPVHSLRPAASSLTPCLRASVPSCLRQGFTLTEILIVVGLIVLMLAMALPAFNFITGGRSVDAAQNNVAAFLARARTEAIGLQETRGVMFFIDPKTPQRVSVAFVHETPAKTSDNPNIDVFLDLTPDSDFLQLPKGVGVQL